MPTDKKAFFEETQELLEDYVSNRVRLLKLQAAEKSSRIVIMLFTGLVIGLLLSLAIYALKLWPGKFILHAWENIIRYQYR
jgi:uncharacterized protein YacL